MLRSRLPEIAAALPPELDAALQQAADEIVVAAKERVPVDTGRLQRAIHAEKTDDGVAVLAGDSEAWYGMLVEHGTRYIPPHPFLIPALEENRDRIDRELQAAVRRAT